MATDADLASLAARWREQAKSVSRFGSLAVPQRFIAFALEQCADDLAALRGMTNDDLVTRTGELAVDPAPQHAPTDPKG